MYARSYPSDTLSPALPKGYDGVAFEEEKEENRDTGRTNTAEEREIKEISAEPSNTLEAESRSVFGGILSPFQNVFSGLFGKTKGLLPRGIGTEEILILITAAFLLFSRDGDPECALILLFLLIVN